MVDGRDRPGRGPQAVELERRADLVIQPRHSGLGPGGFAGQIADVEGRDQRPHQGHGARQIFRRAAGDKAVRAFGQAVLLEARQHCPAVSPQRIGSGAIGVDQPLDGRPFAGGPPRQPEGLATQHDRDLAVQRRLGLGRDLEVQSSHRVPGLVQPEHPPRRLKGDHEGGGVAFRRRPQPVREGRPRHVDDLVAQHRRHDLAPQPVALHLVLEPGERLGEVADQGFLEERILRRVGRHDLVGQFQLGIGHQHGQFGPGQGLASRSHLADLDVAGQALDLAVQLSARDQRLHGPLLGVETARPFRLLQGQGQGLVVVVGQNLEPDLVGHGGQQAVAFTDRQHAVRHRRPDQDLDIDLVVGGVDTGRVVDGVGVHPAAIRGKGDAARLRKAEVGTLAHDLDPQFRGVDAQGIGALVADLGVGLGRSLHIGADAAEIEQVRVRLEDGAHQGDRIDAVFGDVQQGLDLGRQGDRLGLAREDAAAFGDQGLVIVLPGRARQVEHPLALGPGRRRIGRRVDEDVAVIEGGDQLCSL